VLLGLKLFHAQMMAALKNLGVAGTLRGFYAITITLRLVVPHQADSFGFELRPFRRSESAVGSNQSDAQLCLLDEVF